jgi:hypothetical protein
MLVSGIAFAPHFFNRRTASPVDSPFCRPTLIAPTDFGDVALSADTFVVADMAHTPSRQLLSVRHVQKPNRTFRRIVPGVPRSDGADQHQAIAVWFRPAHLQMRQLQSYREDTAWKHIL